MEIASHARTGVARQGVKLRHTDRPGRPTDNIWARYVSNTLRHWPTLAISRFARVFTALSSLWVRTGYGADRRNTLVLF
jgi:hypothetical protein